MAKLIKILAASVGGGLVLGAGIRLGEAIASRNPAPNADGDPKLAERLSDLEGRLRGLEGGNVSPAEPERNREGGTPVLRSEMRDWLEEAVAARVSDAELRLREESERGRGQILDAVAEQIQTRLMQRISKLEQEVAGQSAAMSELRECSLRTERSIQRLLGGLEKLVVRHPSAAEEAADPSSQSGALPEVAEA
ncbi:MAG TPA: hypothetical protein VGL82_05525 [Bryobacteraceae bacterium]